MECLKGSSWLLRLDPPHLSQASRLETVLALPQENMLMSRNIALNLI